VTATPSPSRGISNPGPSASARSAVGVFGGTFDPIHYAHLRLAEELAERLGLSEVRFVPARVPPHRATPSVTADHRLEMVRLAVRGNARFRVDDRECRREGPSYTVDTLGELRAELGNQRPLMLMMGEDSYLALTTWSRWERLYDLAHVVVAGRPGFDLDVAHMNAPLAAQTSPRLTVHPGDLTTSSCGRVYAADTTPLPISATEIRRHLEIGHSARYLLPDGVLDYIRTNQLYKDTDAGRGD
jgi:nicotinate-nucleotide adenylyltransferase